MITLERRQTKVPTGYFGLPAFAGLASPYFTGRELPLTNQKMTVKFFVQEYMGGANGIIYPYGNFSDISNDTYLSTYQPTLDTSLYSTKNDLLNAYYALVVAQAITLGYSSFTASDIIDMASSLTAVTPSSYQTIVSQTGTAAPAVGSLTPVNTYSGSPTFTWARTSAGVYTITASSAVFNTSGKTGVFIQPLTNLNGAFSAVVTSTTVITITTAVQSLAILGLLGFTATPTDGLLNKTMIYIQTY